MQTQRFICSIILLNLWALMLAQENEQFTLDSPNGRLTVKVNTGDMLKWSLSYEGSLLISPSRATITLGDGRILGQDAKVKTSSVKEVETDFPAINYKKALITDHYRELEIEFRGNYGIIFRAYDDAIAYRFYTKFKDEVYILNEVADFNFTRDHSAFIPYMWDYRDGKLFNSSFEALYTESKISMFKRDSLAFLPLLVEIGLGRKLVITEADLEEYPGMYLTLNESDKGFSGVFARYPVDIYQGGYENMNLIPEDRADYIARTKGTRSYPWRVVAFSESDRQLLNNDIVQKLASPSRIDDYSWIKPGQVAWDWWNDWNLSHVDFRAGMNTETYKYYIDFASKYGHEYIIIDWGWSARFDLTDITPGMNIQEIVDYGNSRNVGVILWACWQVILDQMEEVFPVYADMGVKGFKIDFIDRDDQIAVASTYAIAEKAAENKLLVDFHGIYKPTGLQRTYPNIIGYEGVRGLEYFKWSDADAVRYAVTIPYIRMLAGPMDYTPGAMRNAARNCFYPLGSNPMSQGTRCHQLAMYIIYEAPLQMLSDNPTTYMKEHESTVFISNVPVTFDETVAIDGAVGEYVVIARRKETDWYVGAMTNWTPRELELDLSFLGRGNFRAVIYRDGVNAHKDGTDYKIETIEANGRTKIRIRLAPGGGWAARFEKMK